MITEPASKISKSPLTGKEYFIPETATDRPGIDSFLSKHPGKKIVAVQGLGFVGAVMSLVVANALTDEYAVIGIDLANDRSFWKIQSINEGIFPVVADDPKIELFFRRAIAKGNLYATFDPYAYSKADIIVVDINLDVEKIPAGNGEFEDYDIDPGPFRGAITSIGSHCKEDVLVLVETTVPPGTCQKIVLPALADSLAKRGLSADRIKVGHSYERVMPGPKYIDSIQNFYRVFAGVNEESAAATERFLKTIIRTDEYPLTRLGSTNATEMAKVLENSFRAMNIAFMVEWSRFAEEAGVNLYEVVNAIRMRPTHKNIMLPGIGVGGYCLTKDPLLASWARMNLFESNDGLSQSEKGVRINDKMPVYAFEFMKRQYPKSLNGRKILLLGVSYLNDVGDTRYTPVGGLYDKLLESGAVIRLHDPHVVFWEEKQLAVDNDLGHVLLDNYDIVIISTGHREYRNNDWLLKELLEKQPCFIYDTIGVLNDDRIRVLSERHTVKVLGRGDL
jgi:nucleotide sugar dehydrogenase